MAILNVFAIAYFDNIIIYSEIWEDHQQHVRDVLARLRQFCLFCKLFKCEFEITLRAS